MHEASLHDVNSFVTLTYDDDHLPSDLSLNYLHYQKFMKRLRARFKRARIRFYMCGEYGEVNSRPHYHALLFGFGFPDQVVLSRGSNTLYRSPILEELWPFGMSSIGSVTFESAAYVARYCMKKLTGDGDDKYYNIFNPVTGEIWPRRKEFSRMSLKPGIGAPWFEKFGRDVMRSGKVVCRGGLAVQPPRYYDKLMEKVDGGFRCEELQYERYLDALQRLDDNTDERLRVREQVDKARLGLLTRSL